MLDFSWLAQDIAAAFGAKPNEVNYVLCLLLAFPIGAVYSQLKPPIVRYLFSIVVGCWLGFSALGLHSLHYLISSFVAYLIMRSGSARQRHYVFFWCFLQWTDYLGWSLDFTLPLMIVTQKLISLSYSLYDGTNNKNATREQLARSVKKVPSLLEFYAYILFPPTILVGPYVEYCDWYEHAQNKYSCQNAIRLGIRRLTEGMGCIILYLCGDKYIPIGLLSDQRFLSEGHWFIRFLWIDLILFFYRFKYYFAWKFAEAAIAMSGVGQSVVDEKHPQTYYVPIQVIDIVGFELAENSRELTSRWNKTTNAWLRRYVYERTDRRWNLYYTFVISAFWHGFYPGYYLFFISMSLVTAIHRKIRRQLRPMVTKAPWMAFVWRFCSILLTRFTCSYFIVAFTALSFEASFKIHKSLHLIGHEVLLFAVIFFYSGLFDKLMALKNDKQANVVKK
eukprot:jgi/Galph1/2626/GphlegSOOS_G1317.1